MSFIPETTRRLLPWLALVTLLAGCRTAPVADIPITPSSSLLAVDALFPSPLGRDHSLVQAFFVKGPIDAGMDELPELLPASFVKKGRAHLLDPEAGSYALVAVSSELAPPWNRHPVAGVTRTTANERLGHVSVFPAELIEATRTTVRPGDAAFMGVLRLRRSDRIKANAVLQDELQQRLAEVIRPGATSRAGLAGSFSMTWMVDLEATSLSKEAAEREFFFDSALTDLGDSPWARVVAREAPPRVTAARAPKPTPREATAAGARTPEPREVKAPSVERPAPREATAASARTPEPDPVRPAPSPEAVASKPQPVVPAPKPAIPDPIEAPPTPMSGTPEPRESPPLSMPATPEPDEAPPTPALAIPEPSEASATPELAAPKPAIPVPSESPPLPMPATPAPTLATPEPIEAPPAPTLAASEPIETPPTPMPVTPEPTEPPPEPERRVIAGLPPGSPLARIELGMHHGDVRKILGEPDERIERKTAKAFIPFYEGPGARLIDWVYEGVGRVVFSHHTGFLLVFDVVPDPDAPR